VIYAAIMAVIFLIFLRDSTSVVGLGASLPLYIGLSAVMAKFGYQRRTLADLRTPRAAPPSRPGAPADQGSDGAAGSTAQRIRPAPTRRTAAGTNRPPKKRR
jgi:hypothetical protein